MSDLIPVLAGGEPERVAHYLDDLDTAHDQVIKIGGSLLEAAADRSAPGGLRVYADPAGHPFCLCWMPERT